MEKIWSKYFVICIIIGFFNILTDILLSIHLLGGDQPLCSLGILSWILLAVFLSLFYVMIGRCRQGDPMTCMKFLLISSKVHAELLSPYFQAGPSLIVQLVLLWSDVYTNDLKVSGIR